MTTARRNTRPLSSARLVRIATATTPGYFDVVPLAQAVVTSAIRKSNEKNNRSDHSAFARHLPALEKMLWGGSVMLVVDHIINGELTWRFPFFTALENAGGGAVMLREMFTVGVPMSLVITAIWAVYALAKERKKKVQLT